MPVDVTSGVPVDVTVCVQLIKGLDEQLGEWVSDGVHGTLGVGEVVPVDNEVGEGDTVGFDVAVKVPVGEHVGVQVTLREVVPLLVPDGVALGVCVLD